MEPTQPTNPERNAVPEKNPAPQKQESVEPAIPINRLEALPPVQNSTPASQPARTVPQAAEPAVPAIKKNLADFEIASRAQELQKQGKASLQQVAADLIKEREALEAAPKPDIKSKKYAIKPLRTFQGDAAEIIEKNNASVLSIKMAQDEKKLKTEVPKPPPSLLKGRTHCFSR